MAPDLFYLSAKYSQELSEAGLDTVLYSDCNYDWSERSSRIFQFVKTILLYLLPFILMLCAHYKIMVTLRAASQSAQNQLTATIKENEDGVEFQEIEAVDEKASSGRNVCEEIYDYAAGRVQEEQKGNSKAKHNKINAHFRSLATVSILIGCCQSILQQPNILIMILYILLLTKQTTVSANTFT